MSSSRYTVRRVRWHQPPHGDPYTRRLPGPELLDTFDSFDDADECRRALEAEAGAGENPFRFGGGAVFFQSSLDGPRLHDWLLDEGIEPPASELRHSDWRAWWDAFAHTWTDHQRAHARAAFDKVRFFEIAEAAPFTAHVSVAIARNPYREQPGTEPSIERGRLVTVSRRPISVMSGSSRRTARRRTFQSTAYESIAVPSDVPPFAGVGFLVQRRVALEPHDGAMRVDPPRDARVPIALFADRAAAVAERDRQAAEALRTVNPFVFVEPDRGAATADGRAGLAALRLTLPLPANDNREEWLEWYDLCQDEVTDEQRAGIWELCEQPLFEVLSVEVRDG